MILNIIYLALGIVVGLLVKHEFDMKNRKKRVEKRLKNVSTCNFDRENEALKVAKELNHNLRLIQQKQSS